VYVFRRWWAALDEADDLEAVTVAHGDADVVQAPEGTVRELTCGMGNVAGVDVDLPEDGSSVANTSTGMEPREPAVIR